MSTDCLTIIYSEEIAHNSKYFTVARGLQKRGRSVQLRNSNTNHEMFSFQQPSGCHISFFKDTSIDPIILSVCRSLYSEYLLVTKPCSFNFINSHALLNTHACLQPFLCVRVGKLLDFTSTKYLQL